MNRVVTLLITFAAACTSGGSSTGIAPVSCPTDSTLTYVNFGQAMITSQCMSCHAKESPKLGTQANVQSHVNQILQAAVYTDSMPENGDMSLEERQALGEWLACGAP